MVATWLFDLDLLGTNHADHTLLMTAFAILVILSMLLFRKVFMQLISGKRNKRQ